MKLNELLDPRGIQERPMIELAKRPSLDELRNGKILFYNNTKLGFCNYYTVFDRIKERLTELGITNYVEYTETVRGKNQKRLYEYAAMLAQEKPTAAIVAFGDMGTSSSTTVVAIALEKLGIPTVYMTAPPGSAITEGVGVYRAGHLCLCSVDIYQGSTVEEVAWPSLPLETSTFQRTPRLKSRWTSSARIGRITTSKSRRIGRESSPMTTSL